MIYGGCPYDDGGRITFNEGCDECCFVLAFGNTGCINEKVMELMEFNIQVNCGLLCFLLEM